MEQGNLSRHVLQGSRHARCRPHSATSAEEDALANVAAQSGRSRVTDWSRKTPTAPDSQISHGLALGISARGAWAILTLKNTGPDSLSVLSHIDAGERHYDPFTIVLAGTSESRTLHFYDDRNESSPVNVDLAPGQTLEHALDLAAWANRKANGWRPLAPGEYAMSATYHVPPSDRVWNGTLQSSTVPITIA